LVNSIQKKWVWQHSAWPRFTWDTEALIGAIGRVRQAQGEMGATAKLLDPQLGLKAQQETLTTEALMTSAIEGEKLDPAGLRSADHGDVVCGLPFDLAIRLGCISVERYPARGHSPYGHHASSKTS
jgi:hypothetical protein